MKKIGIIGCGNLGLSLLKGIREKEPKTILYGTKRNIETLKSLEDEVTIITTDNKLVIEDNKISNK